MVRVKLRAVRALLGSERRTTRREIESAVRSLPEEGPGEGWASLVADGCGSANPICGLSTALAQNSALGGRPLASAPGLVIESWTGTTLLLWSGVILPSHWRE
ncbi:MAG: hypothetical protein IMW90_21875 [Thermogemmatispora sp.]|uniref:Uncharacterized protein n=1 Tax=Thermogemmatispora aurantia TaxID=2045279 RepID=A0A5J4KE36_9CHLR|nr:MULTISPECIES: hypothetical protein [Thermogemmatispora]MBE3568375.1 hypothetical protein [Thermogemmatispora sp.]GER85222.1 hypothetical protein KTAU_38570 [Thermogemmatispora aurantia]